MKLISPILVILLFMFSCEREGFISSIDPINWQRRIIDFEMSDSLETGTTYLSVYSQIYSMSEHRKHNLTATISMRNTHRNDTIFIQTAEYFNTQGALIRTYFKKPIYLAPMETVEIVIDEVDKEGGTGANFLFDWTVKRGSPEPFFEAVMISTSGQQGLSFTTVGKRIE